MDVFRIELMLGLARELAASHGTFFAAALLADMGVPLPLALATLRHSSFPPECAMNCWKIQPAHD